MTSTPEWKAAVGARLTDHQVDMLDRVSRGQPWSKIASDFGITLQGVSSINKQILRKLGATSAAHAVLLACRAGILDGRPQQRHGDRPGFRAHERRGEEPCDACKAGEAAYRVEMRRKRRQKPSGDPVRAQEPVRAVPELRDGDRGSQRPSEAAA